MVTFKQTRSTKEMCILYHKESNSTLPVIEVDYKTIDKF